MVLHASNTNFIDEHGRKVMLRGINLSGSSKVPFSPPGATHIKDGFFEHRNVSFVGRPFPLEQADEHLSRLREWGFNFLRLLVTWEAIEHAGPGIYDHEYLDYIAEVVKITSKYGFSILIDPHQDVWSRFTGGDGAPGWTLEAVGFDMTHFDETGAAIVHANHPIHYDTTIWQTNAYKLACATMFSLFFAGNDFAPNTRVNGLPIQEYLQQHYFDAIRQVARRLMDQPNVLGYDTLNEPCEGYIGWKSLDSTEGVLPIGDMPTPFQSMLLGAGYAQDVPVWKLGTTGFKRLGTRRMNEAHQVAWREGLDCVWKQNGVWDVAANGNPVLLRPDHFSIVSGRSVDFTHDYYRPFANRFAQVIREVHPDTLIFIETNFDRMITKWDKTDANGIVFAPHWYDGYTLAKKIYSPMLAVDSLNRKLVVSAPVIRRSFRNQLRALAQNARQNLGVPVVLGEFGIPFDINRKEAYRTGNFKVQVKALQRSMRAVEENLLNYALWVYTPDNTNQHGDLWNDEDFSIFSADQRTDPHDINSGGRALQAVVRPYPIATAGEVLTAQFNPYKRRFKFIFRHDPGITAPTELFVPNYQYPHGYSVRVSDGRYEIQRSSQRLLYWPDPERAIHRISIKP